MATGLGEGSVAEELGATAPSHGLAPACLLGALWRGGGTGEMQGEGFPASAPTALTFPLDV